MKYCGVVAVEIARGYRRLGVPGLARKTLICASSLQCHVNTNIVFPALYMHLQTSNDVSIRSLSSIYIQMAHASHKGGLHPR
jgi:hypothetical protein